MKHPSCDFPLKSVHEVSNLISCKINKGSPFSLIRLGDGEGVLMSISSQSPESDFKYLAGHLGPQGVELGDLLHLKDRLIQSINGADIIGVRDDIVDVAFEPDNFFSPHAIFLENFRKSFKLRDVEKSLGYDGSRRISLLHKCLGNLNLHDDSQFCSAWFHYGLYYSGALFGILRQQKRIGLISCRAELPGLLEELFGVFVKFYEIPDMFRDISQDQRPPDYVERLETVLKQQHVESPGMLYLIGGGLYGKLYCQLIKSQGGIALDLGALLDAWLGIPSRQTVYRSMFDMDVNEPDVPLKLILTAENIACLLKPASG